VMCLEKTLNTMLAGHCQLTSLLELVSTACLKS